ncbi:hypothetical protein CAAN1_07S04544 [[Candida] anglica]|uniref:Uncharacterized protein n=1 Tax=[Candida] anglica TaxID=148631 RepID=A0ABP0EBB9_9ASCO
MLSRVGLNTFRVARRNAAQNARFLTTKNSIVDHTNGKVIKLSDPNHPELGDYPIITPVLAQSKDPYAKYDDQQNRRNNNDPLHHDEDMLDMWSPDYYQFVSDKTALKQNGIFFGLFFGFGAVLYYFQLNPEKPAMPRSFPYGGLAKELGSGSAEDDEFYRVKPDLTAETELGFLTASEQIAENRKVYEKANAEFLSS